MCYGVLYTDESGVHYLAGFGAPLGEMSARSRAWEFMRECDAAGVAAGFPFPIDTHGKPLTLAEMLASVEA